MNFLRNILLLFSASAWLSAACARSTFRPGQLWADTQGTAINAHGGGVLCYNHVYYWFGEYKSESTSVALKGITCYASTDLLHWRNKGIALAVSTKKGSDIERGCIMERPKVVYCAKTGKFVMWFHLELKGQGYAAARAAVAVADHPEGPYTYQGSGRVNAGKYPANFSPADIAALDTLHADHYKTWWTPTWLKAVEQGLFLKRDLDGGQMARDMTVFVDDNGKAYHVFSSEDNMTLHIAELTDDYTRHTGRYVRVAPGGQNEAPTLLKHNGKYWMITSGCTGWAPNAARLFAADSLMGAWQQYPNPCRGDKAGTTFGAQGTYVLHLTDGRKPEYIFMADIWTPEHPIDARYVWLPIDFENGRPYIQWRDGWQLRSTKNKK